MSILKRISLKSFPNHDQGIFIKDLVKLIETSEYKSDLIEVFNVEAIKNQFIELPGATTLIETILHMEERVTKLDLVNTQLRNVRCMKITENNQAILEFTNVANEDLIKRERSDMVYAETAYSVRQDYLNGFFDIDKYLSFLKKSNYEDLIEYNLDQLKKKTKDDIREYNFRLVYDEEGKLFTRAITSSAVYKDYNIGFSVFVALIQIHNLIQNHGEKFKVDSLNLNESEISVVFKNLETYQFLDSSKISFALELTNDEIKREAVKFSGLYKINLITSDITLKPDEGKANILSFKHSSKPVTVKDKISELNISIAEFISETIDDFKLIKNAKKPDDLRLNLIKRAKFAGDSDFKKYKSDIIKVLSTRVSTIFQLLEIVSKTETIFSDEDVQAKDFWRFKLYQSLIEDLKKK